MSKHILVIDDDEAVRKAFRLTLGDIGYSVDVAESGERGLEVVKTTEYGLIFLDLKMPGMNGVETLRTLRKIGVTVPVYIVTAFHREFLDQLRTLEAEGIDFEIVEKPITAERMVAVTRGILEGPRELSPKK